MRAGVFIFLTHESQRGLRSLLDLETIISVRYESERRLSLLVDNECVSFQAHAQHRAGQLVFALEPLEILGVGELPVGPPGEDDRLDARFQRDRDRVDIALEVRLELDLLVGECRVVVVLGGAEDLEVPVVERGLDAVV